MMMYFDGSRCELGRRVGIIFFTPQGIPIPYSFKLDFLCMNNNIKYEALILSLRITIDLKVDRLIIYDDSILIVNQVLGLYQYHNELLKSYRELVANLLKHFKILKIDSTPRSLNHFTNTMASLGSLIPPNPHRCI